MMKTDATQMYLQFKTECCDILTEELAVDGSSATP